MIGYVLTTTSVHHLPALLQSIIDSRNDPSTWMGIVRRFEPEAVVHPDLNPASLTPSSSALFVWIPWDFLFLVQYAAVLCATTGKC